MREKLGTAGMKRGLGFAGALVAVLVAGRWLASNKDQPVPLPRAPGAASQAPPARVQEPDDGLPKPPATPPEAVAETPVPAAPPKPEPEVTLTANPLPSESFVRIPAGVFAMGNALAASGDGRPNELPPHPVTLGAFQISQHELTKALWDEVRTWAASHGYTDLPAGKGKAPGHPVHSIDWHAVVKWCNARSEKENLTPCYTVAGEIYRIGNNAPDCDWSATGYRLPTEAEWEMAARGGLSGKRFPWGDTISHNEANLRNEGAEPYQTGTTGDHPAYSAGTEPYTAPVGSFAADPSGLSDMAGNVWEWCWDWYGPYPASDLTDPRGAATGTLRVYRGGSWRSHAGDCRAAARYYSYPGGTYDYVGFRLARGSAVP